MSIVSSHHDTSGASFEDRFTTRLVAPGSCQRCIHCHGTIDFVPGGSREQVARRVFQNGRLHHIELFHPDCYREFCAGN